MPPLVTWTAPEAAILSAIGLAAGVTQVRVLDSERPFHQKQRIWVTFVFADEELLRVEGEDVDEVFQEVIRGNVRVTAQITVLSQSHRADISAPQLALNLLTRANLTIVTEALEAGDLVLNRVGAFSQTQVPIDNRLISAMVGTWEMTLAICHPEGSPDDVPIGGAPRAYFNRVGELNEDGDPLDRRRAVAEAALAQVVRDAASWRSLWTGSQTDLIGGRRLDDQVGLDHNLVPSASIGDDTLDRVSTVAAGVGADVRGDQDAGVVRDAWALAVLVRGPAPSGTRRLFSRLSGSAGYSLDALADGSVEVRDGSGTTLLAAAGVLDGSTWSLILFSRIGGTLALRSDAGVDSTSAVDLYADVPLRLGDAASVSWPAGVELAIFGEASAVTSELSLFTTLKTALGL